MELATNLAADTSLTEWAHPGWPRESAVDDFRALVEPHHPALLAHCHRMLGSLHDAEDALQEALLRAWRGLDRRETGRPLWPWLHRIATNVCLTALGKRPKRVLPLDHPAPSPPGTGSGGPPPPELDGHGRFPDLGEGYAMPEVRYEQREGVELAFVAALQHLPAKQRAVLILREALGFSAREVAHSLDTTVPSVNSALQRARRTLDDRLLDLTQQQTLGSIADDRLREAVKRYAEAWETRNVDAMLAMLVEDATQAGGLASPMNSARNRSIRGS